MQIEVKKVMYSENLNCVEFKRMSGSAMLYYAQVAKYIGGLRKFKEGAQMEKNDFRDSSYNSTTLLV